VLSTRVELGESGTTGDEYLFHAEMITRSLCIMMLDYIIFVCYLYISYIGATHLFFCEIFRIGRDQKKEQAMRQAGEVTEVGTIISEKRVFDDPFFSVVSRVVQTSNGIAREPQLLWDRMGKSFAIAVVTDEEGRYVLVKEAKYGQMQFMISAPTGGVKKNETPLAAAAREFLAETGYVAESWEMLFIGKPIFDFGDKTDGGGHYICVAKNARQTDVPSNADQSVVLASRSEFFGHAISGWMPAMSIAAISLAMEYAQ